MVRRRDKRQGECSERVQMLIKRIAVPVLLLALVACGNNANNANNAAAPAGDAQQVAATSGAPPSSCDAPAVPTALGATVTGAIEETSQPYPANARYYCINVPAGAGSVTMELSGMSVDLDLYVGHGNIQSVQGVDISQGENYEWKSNEFGTGTERVVINTPQPGIYYAEVVSYEGKGSNYSFVAR